ncbi:MAG: hypothetical protein IID44_23295 [Planctomycetes bacterium]|nr:hypothetical protein [Planctomycetota bacterium]
MLTESFSFSVAKNTGFVPLAGFLQAMSGVDFAFGQVAASVPVMWLVGGISFTAVLLLRDCVL